MKNKLTRLGSYFMLILAFMVAFSACTDDDDAPVITDPSTITPEGPNPDWAPDIDPQMLAVIEQLGMFGTPPLTELSPVQARKVPTPTDAVEALLVKNNIQPPPADVSINQQVIPGPSPDGILVRVYTPTSGDGPFPVVVYYHGGGWVIASPAVYEPSAKAIAEKAGAIVVSVAYRQAPENKFPAAHEDAFAAYQWAVNNAASINGDPAKVAVVGESAGGNLAAAVCMMARDRDVQMPVHQVLVYPIADYGFDTESYNEYANAKPLSRPLMQWFFDHYLNSPEEGANPLISLVDAPDLSGLPSATVITAQIDPLMSEGQLYAERMQEAGIGVVYQNFEGVTHEFFGMAAVLEQAVAAQDLAATGLRKAFE